ncbi:expressed unknown protein [Seminavis robusta]|uniref:Uncharacterized protein n=1 Tax=Seminavis robusta TaxID=568900 RepID=A0A9N8HPZ6_9STRA|nr:expressed unknown protein [Seminavis robusta]|eukprot:Sro1229_g254450.1 n/a (316) ;mRNA; r:5726-6673
MRTPMSLLLVFFLLGLSSAESQANLRGVYRNGDSSGVELSDENPTATEHQSSRELQGVAILNSIISLVTPAVSEKISYVISGYYNDYDLLWLEEEEYSINHRLGSAIAKETGDNAVCGGSDFDVAVDLSVTNFVGAGDLSVDAIAFVDGSQNVQLNRQAFKNGATWSGAWIVDVSFPELVGNTTTTFNAACNVDGQVYNEEQTVNGTVTFTEVKTQSLVTITGDTERVILFLSSSELSNAQIQNFTFAYDALDTTNILGDTPVDDLNFDADEVITNLFNEWEVHTQFDGYIARLLTKAVQEEIDWILPRPLLGFE